MSRKAKAPTYRSERIALENAPPRIHELVTYWETRRQADALPLKSAIVPWELPNHIGRLCLIEVVREPLDFIYRLDGSNISSSSSEDLKDRSVLQGTPKLIYEHIFADLKASAEAGMPVLWRAYYAHDKVSYNYLRLVLPLTRRVPGDYLMTYSHSLDTPDGQFAATRR